VPGPPEAQADAQTLARRLREERAAHAADVQALLARLEALEAENECLAAGILQQTDGQSYSNGDGREPVVPRPWQCMHDPPGRPPAPHGCLRGRGCRGTVSGPAGSLPQKLREENWERLSASSTALAEHAASLRAARAHLTGVEAPARDLIQRLEESSDQQFASLCTAVAHRVPVLATADALRLAEFLLAQMKRTALTPGCGRYWTTVSLMELFCTSQQCVEALPVAVLEGLLGEIREHMAYCSWMRCLDSWGERLRMADRACASLLGALRPELAMELLQELQFCPGELADSPCLEECVQRLLGPGEDGSCPARAEEAATAASSPSQSARMPVPSLSLPALHLAAADDERPPLGTPRGGLLGPRPSSGDGPEDGGRRRRRRKRRSNVGA